MMKNLIVSALLGAAAFATFVPAATADPVCAPLAGQYGACAQHEGRETCAWTVTGSAANSLCVAPSQATYCTTMFAQPVGGCHDAVPTLSIPDCHGALGVQACKWNSGWDTCAGVGLGLQGAYACADPRGPSVAACSSLHSSLYDGDCVPTTFSCTVQESYPGHGECSWGNVHVGS